MCVLWRTEHQGKVPFYFCAFSDQIGSQFSAWLEITSRLLKLFSVAATNSGTPWATVLDRSPACLPACPLVSSTLAEVHEVHSQCCTQTLDCHQQPHITSQTGSFYQVCDHARALPAQCYIASLLCIICWGPSNPTYCSGVAR